MFALVKVNAIDIFVFVDKFGNIIVVIRRNSAIWWKSIKRKCVNLKKTDKQAYLYLNLKIGNVRNIYTSMWRNTISINQINKMFVCKNGVFCLNHDEVFIGKLKKIADVTPHIIMAIHKKYLYLNS